jgi:BASS family bile acid:Na+ symporter
VQSILSDPGYVFLSALLLGLLLGGIRYHPEIITLACLMVALSLSTTRVKFQDAFSIGNKWKFLIVIMLLNYAALTGIILFLGAVIDFTWEVWAGIVIMAAVPPAVAIIPFNTLLDGDDELAVPGVAFAYLASLLLTPLIVLVFLGENTNIWELVRALILMIMLPLIISRGLRKINVDEKMGVYKPITVNLAFAVLIFTVVGVNRSVFFDDFSLVIALVFLSLMRTLFIGSTAYYVGKRSGIEKSRNVTYTLFASYKNLGLAIVIAFGLFGSMATIPATIGIPFETIAFVYFKKALMK